MKKVSRYKGKPINSLYEKFSFVRLKLTLKVKAKIKKAVRKKSYCCKIKISVFHTGTVNILAMKF